MKLQPRLYALLTTFALVVGSLSLAQATEFKRIYDPAPKSKIVFIGNTLAERMSFYGHFETYLHKRFGDRKLTVRNLGWSADELTLRPRSLDFQNHGHRLEDHKPDAVFAFFGFNESFGGDAGLEKFRTDLTEFIKTTTTTAYNGKSAPQLVLFTPIPAEDIRTTRPTLRDPAPLNEQIGKYAAAIVEIAGQHQVPVVDLFTLATKEIANPKTDWTFNGIHLTDSGNRELATLIDFTMFGPQTRDMRVDVQKLHDEVQAKNLQFYYDYRAVNGYYIYGGRKEPFGVVNFPAEFAKLRKIIAVHDERIWKIATNQPVSDQPDYSATGEFAKIESNVKSENIKLTTPEEQLASFKLPEGFEANLFASEIEFPDLIKPCQMSFDTAGRLWVCTMPSYPQYVPGVPVDDKLLILEDTNGDGKADKSTVFADKLYLPTGFEFGEGGVFVAQQPNLLFLKDTDGDSKADHREVVLHGFDSADSHHSISAFTWDPAGGLYFEEGTFHHSQIETFDGPQRVKDAAVFRYHPRSERFDVFVSYPFANPWGHVFDRWGQDFVADASGGANYFAAPFSGHVVYGQKHGGMNQFLQMQWRPTCGCEFVSSANFPDEMQGDYLLNNCIGFHGVLQYRMREEGSGFAASPVTPLLQSTDTNFRPVDIKFGPDGALYLVDWFNPLVGHMQHSVRDPNRDKTHGRVWRVHYKNKPLVQPAKIAGEPIPKLLDLLKAYEDRTRYRVRLELQTRPTAELMSELDKWLAAQSTSDKDFEHHQLEALWVRSLHDVVDRDLLGKVLSSPEPRARAAAVRVLCYWRDRVENTVELLKKAANDEHPRVRLEAVRAASYLAPESATEVALEVLNHPQDYYIEYCFKETMNTIDRVTAGEK